MKTLLYMVIATLILLTNCNTAIFAATPYNYSQSFVGCAQDTNYPTDGPACGTNNIMYNSVNYGACTGSGYQQVSLAANNPNGGGGRGWRRWVCGGTYPGISPTTGIISISLNSEPEIWLRFYTRWQPGFAWNSNAPNGLQFQKVIYLYTANTGGGLDLQGPDNISFGGNMGGTMYYGSGSGSGWNTINPTGVMQPNGVRLGDGSWHSIELHWKKQSTIGVADGIVQVWIDGILKMDVHNMVWSTTYNDPGITSIRFMVNAIVNSQTVPMYNDLDDFAISNTGYIGPIGGNLPAVPTPPSNVH